MEIVYALALVVSTVSGAASILLGLAAHHRLRTVSPGKIARPSAPKTSRLICYATVFAAVGGVLGLIFCTVHWRWEHGAGSVAPMSAGAFVSSHPSFLIGVVLAAAGLMLVWVARAKIADREP